MPTFDVGFLNLRLISHSDTCSDNLQFSHDVDLSSDQKLPLRSKKMITMMFNILSPSLHAIVDGEHLTPTFGPHALTFIDRID